MAKPGSQRRSIDPWLIRIDLPGMEIEDAWLLVTLVDPPERPGVEPVGHQPEVPATARRQLVACDLDRGHRQLQDRIRVKPERESRRLGHAVDIVADRIDARAVDIAGLA